MAKAESIESFYPDQNVDWDTPFLASPSAAVGEFAAAGARPAVADLSAPSFTETSRTPVDGDESRSQGKFPTSNGGKSS